MPASHSSSRRSATSTASRLAARSSSFASTVLTASACSASTLICLSRKASATAMIASKLSLRRPAVCRRFPAPRSIRRRIWFARSCGSLRSSWRATSICSQAASASVRAEIRSSTSSIRCSGDGSAAIREQVSASRRGLPTIGFDVVVDLYASWSRARATRRPRPRRGLASWRGFRQAPDALARRPAPTCHRAPMPARIRPRSRRSRSLTDALPKPRLGRAGWRPRLASSATVDRGTKGVQPRRSRRMVALVFGEAFGNDRALLRNLRAAFSMRQSARRSEPKRQQRRTITRPWCRRRSAACHRIVPASSASRRPDLAQVLALPRFRQSRGQPCPGRLGHRPFLTYPLACRLKRIERSRGLIAGDSHSGGNAGSLFDHGADGADNGRWQEQCARVRLGGSSQGGKASRHGVIEDLQLDPAVGQVQAGRDIAHLALRQCRECVRRSQGSHRPLPPTRFSSSRARFRRCSPIAGFCRLASSSIISATLPVHVASGEAMSGNSASRAVFRLISARMGTRAE